MLCRDYLLFEFTYFLPIAASGLLGSLISPLILSGLGQRLILVGILVGIVASTCLTDSLLFWLNLPPLLLYFLGALIGLTGFELVFWIQLNYLKIKTQITLK